MKKFLLLALMALSCSFVAKAQIYVGGTVGFSYTHFKFCEENKGGGASFKFLPEVGYRLNDRMAAGLTVGYVNGLSAMGSFDPSDMKGMMSSFAAIGSELLASDVASNTHVGAFRLAPYFRYTFYRTGRLEFFADAVLGLNLGSVTTGGSTTDFGDEQIEIEKTRKGFTAFELMLRPGMSLSLTDDFKLFAKLGGFGFQHAGINGEVQQLSRFGLDLDGNNIVFGLTYDLSGIFRK